MSETTNFNRLIRLIAKIGSNVIRELLNKYSSPENFMDYLYHNQDLLNKLKLRDDEIDLLSNRDFEKMDITFLCKLASNIFKDNMTHDEKIYLDKIKQQRNSFLHSGILESCRVDDVAFQRKWQEISAILLDLALEVGGAERGADLQLKIKTAIEDIKTSSLESAEIKEMLVQLTGKVELLQTKFEELDGLYFILKRVLNFN